MMSCKQAKMLYGNKDKNFYKQLHCEVNLIQLFLVFASKFVCSVTCKSQSLVLQPADVNSSVLQQGVTPLLPLKISYGCFWWWQCWGAIPTENFLHTLFQ